MKRLIHSILISLVFVSGVASAQNWNSPDEFFNLSPQVGGTTAPSGDLFAGVIASRYIQASDGLYIGAGAGAYVQGKEAVGEILLKAGLNGILGASVGPSFSGSGGITVTNDVWANALLAGVRWRMDHHKEQTIHSVALFVPLGLWIQE
ncbi:MAG: hypothetical protein IPK50_00200 [Fibrobacterota bacterium]|nr:hypothetical protein [Fibrobacterota bacterium]QQS05341.1 MAG: hypothetical protein IPK50_00200 [Fibrobacterota bacterium]